MRKQEKQLLAILLSLAGLLVSVWALASLYRDDRALRDGQRVRFADPAGQMLAGTYYPGEIERGVILAEGFGSDQVTMRDLASQFAAAGFHVFTFDFSGHGRSPGGLGFDNARTDTQAGQLLAAKAEFMRLSGLRADRLLMVGHSLGARVILQASLSDPEPVAGLILLGTQVNLTTNTQAEVFTGTSDADLEWVRSLGPGNPPMPILLVSGAWDDILTPEAAALLHEKLGGEAAGRTLEIIPALVHNYEVFDRRAIDVAESPSRVGRWGMALAGLLLALGAAQVWSAPFAKEPKAAEVAIHNLRRFLWARAWLWLAALPLLALIFGLVFVLPFPFPAFNLIYVGFLGSYGLLLWILYWRGKMPGVSGRLPFARPMPFEGKRVLAALAFFGVVLALVTAFARSGWFDAPPYGLRMVWLLIFTPVTALGFWIGQHEAVLIRRVTDRRWPQTVATLLGLLPFFLWTGFLLAIGSLSGLIGSLQGLLILAIALMTGSVVQNLGRQAWLTATLQAILLYWLILPQGVLFL